MRGIAGRQTRGLPTMARLHVADNTGAKIVQIVNDQAGRVALLYIGSRI